MPRTAAQIAAAVRSGELTAREATEEALARIDKADAAIGAFQQLRVFAALREADVVDRRTDRFSLPLAGVPIAIKDNVPVAGEPMRIGSAATDSTPQPADHEVVRRLRKAGAVVVGMTKVPELCVFGATDSVYGITRNPWNPARTPGGSSGGSAAAVAAGMVSVAHGNDGLGSIRIPSACCGLVGLKPGRGVIPSELGNGSWYGMAENGALATTVEDCALVTAVLADASDLATVVEPERCRIGVASAFPGLPVPIDRHWAAATRESAQLLAEAGHSVLDAGPRYPALLTATEVARWTAGTAQDAKLVAAPDRLEARIRRHAGVGRLVIRMGMPGSRGMQRWRRAAEAFFAEHDVLMTPTLARPPIAAREWSERGWLVNVASNASYAPFAAPWNVLGWPAIAVPAGLDPGGLPLSVQLVTRPGGESLLLGLARLLERARPWPRTAPI